MKSRNPTSRELIGNQQNRHVWRRYSYWNNPTPTAVEYNVAVTSRWFPPVLAVVQTVIYFGLLGYDYWIGARVEKPANVHQYLRQDLARPLFEPSEWCGAYTRYGFGQSAVFGIDLPAQIGASSLLSLINWQSSCAEALTTPRGQLITAALVPVVWLLVGMSIRRLAQRRWRKHVVGPLRLVPALLIVAFPIAVLCIVVSGIVVFAGEASVSIRLAGLAFWLLYIATLAAERIRVWPFTLGSGSLDVRP